MNATQQVPDSMYLVLPVPFRAHDGKLFVEAQAANGLDRWADNFAQIVVAAPVIPEEQAANLPGFLWRDVATLEHAARIVCRPLPWAYSPATFFKQLVPVRHQIAASIHQAQYLQLAIGGLIGDWAAVAAVEAIKQKRAYSIHTDRVEHELIRKTSTGQSAVRRMRIAVEAPLMERYHRHIIRHCSLGLWHGDDCYRAYAPWASAGRNQLIHDVHTKPEDLISAEDLARKLEDARTSKTLRLAYAGRLDAMKAPLEWLAAIASARDAGAKITATWFGEGPLLEAAKSECQRLQLESIVRYPGFVSDRAVLLAELRRANAVVFTHVTPESPRILLESLVCGTPIVGYDNPFAVNLIETQGGGTLVPIHDAAALGRTIAELAADRSRLVQLTQQAAANGRRFNDAAVFAERSQLIKQLS